MLDRRLFLYACGAGLIANAGSQAAAVSTAIGPSPPMRIDVFDARLTEIVETTAEIEVLATGFAWIEGPTWDSKRSRLYFSDIPQNRIYTWSQRDGVGVWRDPAGSGDAPDFVMPGTNGLLYSPVDDSLLVCDQDSRSILQYDANGKSAVPVLPPGEGATFNSPNDLARASEGSLYFTDPPYGLPERSRTPEHLRPFNGVYRTGVDRRVDLVDGTLTFPNGIALSPDERTLYVSVSDPAWPRIVRYIRRSSGWQRDGDCWFDMRMFQSDGSPGMPDGMAVTAKGTLLASAPGGIAVIDAGGRALGRIVTGRATGNCCLGEKETALFITAGDVLLRVPLSRSGIVDS